VPSPLGRETAVIRTATPVSAISLVGQPMPEGRPALRRGAPADAIPPARQAADASNGPDTDSGVEPESVAGRGRAKMFSRGGLIASAPELSIEGFVAIDPKRDEWRSWPP
jgi:hypothetical protein